MAESAALVHGLRENGTIKSTVPLRVDPMKRRSRELTERAAYAMGSAISAGTEEALNDSRP